MMHFLLLWHVHDGLSVDVLLILIKGTELYDQSQLNMFLFPWEMEKIKWWNHQRFLKIFLGSASSLFCSYFIGQIQCKYNSQAWS